jgi:hypothetical protein
VLCKRAKELLPPILKNEIINESILKGISPVKGAGRFKKYSESYLKQISKIAQKLRVQQLYQAILFQLSIPDKKRQ